LFLFTDCVIEQIGKGIAAHMPERGGALLGPPAMPLVSHFLADAQASVTRGSYIPSIDLVQGVAEIEQTEGLQFKGVIHSHPGSLDRPSGPDQRAFRRGLDLNPRMAAFLAPIVTLDRAADESRPNEITITADSRMTVHVAYRRTPKQDTEPLKRSSTRPGGERLIIETPPCQVIPVGVHVSEVMDGLAKEGEPTGQLRWGTLAVNGIHFISATFLMAGSEVIFLFPPTYPTSKPALLVTKIAQDHFDDTREISFGWELLAGERLWAACGQPLLAVARRHRSALERLLS
jgi:hypothetical protein